MGLVQGYAGARRGIALGRSAGLHKGALQDCARAQCGIAWRRKQGCARAQCTAAQGRSAGLRNGTVRIYTKAKCRAAHGCSVGLRRGAVPGRVGVQ